MLRKYCRYLFIFLLFLLLVSFKIQAGDVEVISIPYQENNQIIDIDINIPVLIQMKNKRVQNGFNDKIRENIFNFVEKLKKDAKQFYYDCQEEGWPFRKFSAVVDFEIKNRNRIFSMVIKYYQYTGGAHGLTTWNSYNLDLKTFSSLSFKEILAMIDLNIEIVNDRIKTEIGKNPGNYFTDEMGFTAVSQNQGYYIKNNKLTIFFQLYEIAPYVAGIPEFTIPFSYKNY